MEIHSIEKINTLMVNDSRSSLVALFSKIDGSGFISGDVRRNHLNC
jgi:hypothetical protein